MSVTKPVWLNRAHLTSREWLKLIDANGVRLTVGETVFLLSTRSQSLFRIKFRTEVVLGPRQLFVVIENGHN